MQIQELENHYYATAAYPFSPFVQQSNTPMREFVVNRPPLDTPIIKIDFENCDYEGVLSSLGDNDHLAMSAAFRKAAEDKLLGRKTGEAAALWLFADVCEMMLVPIDRKGKAKINPFEPLCTWGDIPSCNIEIYPVSFINFIQKNYKDINNTFLCARLADIIWLRKGDHKAAICAIEAYTADKKALGTWFSDEYGKSIERAVILCKRLGQKENLAEIEQFLIDLLFSADSEDIKFPGIICGPADIILRQKLANDNDRNTALAEFFGKLAKDGHGGSLFCYHEMAAEFYKRNGNKGNFYEMLFLKGQAFERGTSDNFMEKGEFFGRAIEAYKEIPKEERIKIFGVHGLPVTHIEDLRKDIRNSTKAAFEDPKAYGLHTFKFEIDISEGIKMAQEKVEGKAFEQALFALACLTPWVKEADLEKHTGGSIFSSIAQTGTISSDGRSIKAPKFELMRAYRYKIGLMENFIRAALDKIREEHIRVAEEDFLHIARVSPIVPLDREHLIAKALFYGCQRDFAASLYILAPQIENIVRYHLARIGYLTSTKDEKEGNEEETSLNTLIEKQGIKDCFYEDIIFELRILFCEKSGSNLRNETAHGLRNDAQSAGAEAVYAWYILLKLVFSQICEKQVMPCSSYDDFMKAARRDTE